MSQVKFIHVIYLGKTDMKNNYAPILVFSYNRLDHFKETIEKLKQCNLADQSDLIIYSDGAKNDSDKIIVERIREYASTINGFKSVNLISLDRNYGLAANIIKGVSDVINQCGKVIVLEDDLLVSSQFLQYMNESLDKFQNVQEIWHVSGWNYPIDTIGLPKLLPIRIMNCWGWGTWKDRWSHFEKNPEKLIQQFDKKDIKVFDVDNSGVFWSQVLANHNNTINTWAIFWYATIYLNKGICINPLKSFVKNIGHDGSGTHKSSAKEIYTQDFEYLDFSHEDFDLDKVQENELAIQRIKKFYQDIKPTFFKKLKYKLSLFLSVKK